MRRPTDVDPIRRIPSWLIILFLVLVWGIWFAAWIGTEFRWREFLAPLSLTLAALIWIASSSYLSRRAGTAATISAFVIAVVVTLWSTSYW